MSVSAANASMRSEAPELKPLESLESWKMIKTAGLSLSPERTQECGRMISMSCFRSISTQPNKNSIQQTLCETASAVFPLTPMNQHHSKMVLPRPRAKSPGLSAPADVAFGLLLNQIAPLKWSIRYPLFRRGSNRSYTMRYQLHRLSKKTKKKAKVPCPMYFQCILCVFCDMLRQFATVCDRLRPSSPRLHPPP